MHLSFILATLPKQCHASTAILTAGVDVDRCFSRKALQGSPLFYLGHIMTYRPVRILIMYGLLHASCRQFTTDTILYLSVTIVTRSRQSYTKIKPAKRKG